jgi:protease YdgD
MLTVSARRVLAALFSFAALTAGSSAAMSSMDLHREAVDEQRYPWSAVGKLFNGTGAACSGVVISHDAILTAAHCLYNARVGRFIPAEELHFLVGYRTGNYSTHARIASYQIGPGFEPLSYEKTSGSDWAVLTVTKNLPGNIEPLRLRRNLVPSGTKAVLVGYPRDRAFAMTADRDCELREKLNAGRLLLHSCRSTFGYSGAPILVGTGGREVEVAGIQISSMRGDGMEKMIAVSAQSIWSQNWDAVREVPASVELKCRPTTVAGHRATWLSLWPCPLYP